LGAGFGLVMLVYIVGILAAVALPAYHDYTVKTKLSAVITGSQRARDALGNYYQSNQKTPESLEAIGIHSPLPDGTQLSLDARKMILTVGTPQGELIFRPSVDDEGHVRWSCSNGEGIKPTQLPASCRGSTRQ
jgi:type II secretory pathway pseudopilin PulG